MVEELRVADLQLDELGRVILPPEMDAVPAPLIAQLEEFCVPESQCPAHPPPQPPATPDTECNCPPPAPNVDCSCPQPTETNPDCQNV